MNGNTTSDSCDNTSWNDLPTAYDGQKIAYEGQACNASGSIVSSTVVSGNLDSVRNMFRRVLMQGRLPYSLLPRLTLHFRCPGIAEWCGRENDGRDAGPFQRGLCFKTQ